MLRLQEPHEVSTLSQKVRVDAYYDEFLYTSAGNRSDSMNERVTTDHGSVDASERGGGISVTRSIGRSIASCQGVF